MFNDKLLKFSLAFIAILIIVGLITINAVLSDDESKPSYTEAPKVGKVTNLSTDQKEVNLDTIFINIRANNYKILKTDMAFKMKNPNSKKAVQANMDNVRNAILQYLSSMDANKLNTEKGKEQLKQEIIDMMEESFGYQIETIYFKNFLLSP